MAKLIDEELVDIRDPKWVHLPFAIGDTVWYITGLKKKVAKSGQVESITIGNDFIDLLICSHIEGGKIHMTKPSYKFYSSKAEAEEVLKEVAK